MHSVLNKLLPEFTRSIRLVEFRKEWIAGILALQMGSVIFEGIGLGSVIPVLEYMKNDGNLALLLDESKSWRIAASVLGSVGISIGLGSLLSMAFTAIILRQIFMYARLVYSNRIQSELIYKTRNRLFENYLYGSLTEHDKFMSGDIINDMSVELERAIGAMRSAIDFIALLALISAYVFVVFTMSVGLSLAAGLILIIVGYFLIYITRRVESLGRIITAVNQNISAFLVERLNAVRLVRLSGVEKAELERFERFTRAQRDSKIDLQRLKAIFSVSVEPLILAFAFVLLFISIEGKVLGFEQIVVFFFILLRLAPVAREAMLQRQSYISLLGSISAISDRMTSLAAAREPEGGPLELTDLTQGIEFCGVSFSYPTRKDAPALRNISLNFASGMMTAVVGPSGAGKSTLVDLLPRLRSPDTGRILFDEIDQSEYSTTSLRHAVAYVTQNAQILDLKVAEQIALGRPLASREDIISAARQAGAHDFIITLPEGYDTPLGEGGGRLSGGQRQRIDLARAIIRGAPILILDEPTASLDAESEAAFKAALSRLRKETGMTIVIIGHRFSTIADADQIIVLENGSVSETGKHSELVNSGGWYAKAYKKQQLTTTAEPSGEIQPKYLDNAL